MLKIAKVVASQREVVDEVSRARQVLRVDGREQVRNLGFARQQMLPHRPELRGEALEHSWREHPFSRPDVVHSHRHRRSETAQRAPSVRLQLHYRAP